MLLTLTLQCLQHDSTNDLVVTETSSYLLQRMQLWQKTGGITGETLVVVTGTILQNHQRKGITMLLQKYDSFSNVQHISLFNHQCKGITTLLQKYDSFSNVQFISLVDYHPSNSHSDKIFPLLIIIPATATVTKYFPC